MTKRQKHRKAERESEKERERDRQTEIRRHSKAETGKQRWTDIAKLIYNNKHQLNTFGHHINVPSYVLS